jgi:hypothetical protein
MFFGILWAASADGYGTTVRAVVMDSRLCQCGWKRSRQVAAQQEYCRYTLAPPHASYYARKLGCERFPCRIWISTHAFPEPWFRGRARLPGVPRSAVSAHPRPFPQGHGVPADA